MQILTAVNTGQDVLRTIFATIDQGVYFLVSLVTDLIFNIARFTVNPDFVTAFIGRVYVVISIYALFKLAFSLLNGIINPDSLTDKNTGMQKIIPRILISLSMLVFFPAVLFPKLIDWQEPIIKAIPMIVLGRTGEINYTIGDPSSIGSEIVGQTLQAFIYPSKECDPNLKISESDFGMLLTEKYTHSKCAADHHLYAYDYRYIVSTLAGFLLLFVMLGFTIDVSIRALKMCLLQVLAPIPIISYIDPKSQKDGAFGSWLKLFISTYLDLFIKIAVVYFGVFCISHLFSLDENVFTFGTNFGDGVTKATVIVFITIGLLFFLRQAPKFIMDILGIKGGGSSIGLSGMLAGTAALVGGTGITGAVSASLGQMNDAASAAAQGKQAPGAWSRGSDLAAQIRTGNPNAKGGVFNRASQFLQSQTAENAARRAGLSKGDIDAQKSAVKAAQTAYDEALFQEQNARSRWEKLTSSEEPFTLRNPGTFSEAEPQPPSKVKPPDGVQWSEGARMAAEKRYNEQQAQYETAHAAWESRKTAHEAAVNEYNARFAEHARLEMERQDLEKQLQDAHNATLAAKVTLDERTSKLGDAKDSRKAMLGDKSSKYNAQRGKHFEHD